MLPFIVMDGPGGAGGVSADGCLTVLGHRTKTGRILPGYGWPWSFYILLVTFMGISPGGARESSPWREAWEQTRTAKSPGGAEEPFHGDSPIAGPEGPSYAPTGLARLWAGPTGLTPWAIF